MQTSANPSDSYRAASLNRNHHVEKYLIFHLGLEQCGTEVLKVREIIGLLEITCVPQAPRFVRGVVNLRGKVIPVIDLRVKFGLPEIDYTARTCIVVVRTTRADEEIQMGIIVDGVAEVLSLTSADIEAAPNFGSGVMTSYLKGIAKVHGRVKILLDIDEVLSTDEAGGLEGLLK